jgi:S-DNA-T family DNA segregation ATPase FtsK/SpoIIIE
VLLRQANRDEHVLAGGDGHTFDPRLPAGSGIWRGAAVQLAFGGGRLPAPAPPELASVRLAAPGAGGRGTLAIIAGHPRELEEAIAARGARLMRLSEDRLPDDAELRVWGGQHPIVLLGDPDAWQAHWSLLGQVRREVPLVVIGCTAAELRAVARIREVPPPLGHRPGECWLIEHGEVRRAQLEI